MEDTWKGALSWAESLAFPVWLAEQTGYEAFGNDHERWLFVLLTFISSVATFWVANFYFILLEKTKMFEHLKICLSRSPPSEELINTALMDIIPTHFLVVPVASFFVYSFVQGTCSFAVEDLPATGTLIWQLLVSSQVDDFLFYWSHRGLHHRYIYKYIHKQHHEFKHTIGLSAEYAHPVEAVLGNILPTVAGPVLLGSHILVLQLYIALKVWQSVDAHCGYDYPFPFSVWSVLPGMDCAPAHDYHHSHNVGNYGGYTMFWDWACGTNVSYNKHLKKLHEKKEKGV